jgi:type II secretory pathway pseudopilin PulG
MRTFARGFTYLSLLCFVAVLGIGLGATAASWQTERQRQKERELLFIGEEFREAIALYYNRSPGEVPEFPRKLQDLLQDPRYPIMQRYLRRIYRDPIVGQEKWGTVPAPDGGIMGVYSLSNSTPVKTYGIPGDASEKYSDWRFVYQPTELMTGDQ